jgi:hypothetical protein
MMERKLSLARCEVRFLPKCWRADRTTSGSSKRTSSKWHRGCARVCTSGRARSASLRLRRLSTQWLLQTLSASHEANIVRVNPSYNRDARAAKEPLADARLV